MAKTKEKDAVKDEFLNDINEMASQNTAVETKAPDPFDVAEPEGVDLVLGSKFWDWRDKDDKPYIGKVFVGAYLGEHDNPDKEDFTQTILGYDFKGLDGNDWILGNNYSLQQALELEVKDKTTGALVKIKDMTKPVLWMKLLSVDASKKGDFNRFKIKLVTPQTK